MTCLFAGRGKTGTVGGDTLDHPKRGVIAAGAAGDPRHRGDHPRGGVRELGGIDDFTSGSQDCKDVIAGVCVDADDE